MYYYGLDFHDLAPNSFLHISVFIVVCEAFLRVPPHFGLWLKVFNVKPKVVEGQHAECGGAMVSKLNKVTWPKGRFVYTVKVWQQEWFYITKPRGTKWAATPAFISGPPLWLTSWTNKGLDWGLTASWIWGYPALPACGPPRGSIDGLVRPSFNTNTTRP